MGYCRELSIGYQQNSRGSSAHKMQRRQQKIRKEQWFQVEFAICYNRNPEHSAHRVILHKKWGRAVSVLLTESQLSVNAVARMYRRNRVSRRRSLSWWRTWRITFSLALASHSLSKVRFSHLWVLLVTHPCHRSKSNHEQAAQARLLMTFSRQIEIVIPVLSIKNFPGNFLVIIRDVL